MTVPDGYLTIGQVIDGSYKGREIGGMCEKCHGEDMPVYPVYIDGSKREVCLYCLDYRWGIVPDGEVGDYSGNRGPHCDFGHHHEVYDSPRHIEDFISILAVRGIPRDYHARPDMLRWLRGHRRTDEKLVAEFEWDGKQPKKLPVWAWFGDGEAHLVVASPETDEEGCAGEDEESFKWVTLCGRVYDKWLCPSRDHGRCPHCIRVCKEIQAANVEQCDPAEKKKRC